MSRPDPPAICASCGRVADDEVPLGWSTEAAQRSGRTVRWACDGCTRRDVRSIEAKLDRQWW